MTPTAAGHSYQEQYNKLSVSHSIALPITAMSVIIITAKDDRVAVLNNPSGLRNRKRTVKRPT